MPNRRHLGAPAGAKQGRRHASMNQVNRRSLGWLLLPTLSLIIATVYAATDAQYLYIPERAYS